jgi:hypothetical protein
LQWGTPYPQAESRPEGSAGAKSMRNRRLNLPAGTNPLLLSKRRGGAMVVLLTYQFTPLHACTQETSPKSVGPTLCLLPSLDSPYAVNKEIKWLTCSGDFSTFDQESLHHSNSPSHDSPAGIAAFTTSHTNHRRSRNQINSHSEIEQTGTVIERYPWRLL